MVFLFGFLYFFLCFWKNFLDFFLYLRNIFLCFFLYLRNIFLCFFLYLRNIFLCFFLYLRKNFLCFFLYLRNNWLFACFLFSCQSKLRYQAVQKIGLSGKFFRCSGRLLCCRWIVLYRSGNLFDTRTNLGYSFCFFFRCRRNIPDKAVYLHCVLRNCTQRLCSLFRNLSTFFYRKNGFFNQSRRILCRLRWFLCQISNLIRNNGKAFSRSTCSGCLYRRIQRQDIGLKRYIIDCFNNLIDFIGFVGDFQHSLGHLRHLLIASFYRLAGMSGKNGSLYCHICSFLYLYGNVVHSRAQLLNGRSLLCRPLGKPLCRWTDLSCTGIDCTCTVLNFRHGFIQVPGNLL